MMHARIIFLAGSGDHQLLDMKPAPARVKLALVALATAQWLLFALVTETQDSSL